MIVGISISHSCVVFLNPTLTLVIVISLFLRVHDTHQTKIGSSSMHLVLANFVISTRLNYFTCLSGTQDSELSFHAARSFHPIVLFLIFLPPLLFTINLSILSIAPFSFLKSTMESKMAYCQNLQSKTWESRFHAMTLAAHSLTMPSWNSTSCVIEFRWGSSPIIPTVVLSGQLLF